jgi:hypothetical protein
MYCASTPDPASSGKFAAQRLCQLGLVMLSVYAGYSVLHGSGTRGPVAQSVFQKLPSCFITPSKAFAASIDCPWFDAKFSVWADWISSAVRKRKMNIISATATRVSASVVPREAFNL